MSIRNNNFKHKSAAFYTVAFLILANIFCGWPLLAQEKNQTTLLSKKIVLNIASIQTTANIAAASPDGKLRFVFNSAAIRGTNSIEILEVGDPMEMPWQMIQASPIYQYDFLEGRPDRAFLIQIKYSRKSENLKTVYFFDKTSNSWRALPTKDHPGQMLAQALATFPFSRIAVLENPRILSVGKASWYKFKTKNTAASPDFPLGSRLRVHNTDNNKFVEVTIADHGPDRAAHPNRVVDLEKYAFQAIADPRDGLANISIEPLSVKAGMSDYFPRLIATSAPAVKAGSAIVVDNKTGEVLFSKNPDQVLPLASLSKLVAADVFFAAKPDMEKIVAYSVADENHNYKYCNKWESARLRVDDGETLKIKDLVYSALLGSANNAIESMVRASGMKRETFIEKMNSTVKEWGASSTFFEEPTGLSPKNVSSSRDYAIIIKKSLENPEIKKISSVYSYSFSTINTKIAHRIKNTDKLLDISRFTIVGAKTGYLDEAGYCLAALAKDAKGNSITAVTFGAPNRDNSFYSTNDLLEYGFKAIME